MLGRGLAHAWPEILPGGDSVLFTIGSGSLETSQIAVLSLATLEYEVVLSGGAFPRYSPTGHLLYGVQGNLWAVGFDVDRLETVGDPVLVQEDVLTKLTGAADFSMSANGSLVYLTGEVGGRAPRSLVWVDRDGREEPVPAESQPYTSVRLSADDQQVVTQLRLDVDVAGSDLFLYDVARDLLSPFTFNPAGLDDYPIWTADGARVLWTASDQRGGGLRYIVWKAADGTDAPICQDSRSRSQVCGLARSVVCHHALKDLAGEKAFETADDLPFGPPFSGASFDVVEGW